MGGGGGGGGEGGEGYGGGDPYYILFNASIYVFNGLKLNNS